jgi:hypothetical protein
LAEVRRLILRVATVLFLLLVLVAVETTVAIEVTLANMSSDS